VVPALMHSPLRGSCGWVPWGRLRMRHRRIRVVGREEAGGPRRDPPAYVEDFGRFRATRAGEPARSPARGLEVAWVLRSRLRGWRSETLMARCLLAGLAVLAACSTSDSPQSEGRPTPVHERLAVVDARGPASPDNIAAWRETLAALQAFCPSQRAERIGDMIVAGHQSYTERGGRKAMLVFAKEAAAVAPVVAKSGIKNKDGSLPGCAEVLALVSVSLDK